MKNVYFPYHIANFRKMVISSTFFNCIGLGIKVEIGLFWAFYGLYKE